MQCLFGLDWEVGVSNHHYRFRSMVHQAVNRLVLGGFVLSLILSFSLTWLAHYLVSGLYVRFLIWVGLSVGVGLVMMGILGRWILHNVERVRALERAVQSFRDDGRVSLEFVRALVAARGDQRDEISVVADALEDLADSTERHENRRLREQAQQHLWARVFASSLDAIAISARDRRLLTVNGAFTRITGYTEQEVLGTELLGTTVPVPTETSLERVWQMAGENGYWSGELLDKRKDGTLYPRWVSVSVVLDAYRNISHYIAVFKDITEQKESESRFIYQANHDRLTGLPNRHLLHDRLSRSIRLAERNQHKLALLFLDLDNFKWVNDSLGHATGDQLLIAVSQRLQSNVRSSDTVARLGGDEFVVLLHQPSGHQELSMIAQKIIDAIEQPIILGGYDFHTTTSIGISLFPEDGVEADVLLKHADAAMYAAKSAGKSGFRFFDLEMNRRAMARVEVERDLRRAIEHHEFELYFQPKYCLETQRLCGMEALIRWQHPRYGLMMPDYFIPVAEETALIIPLGEWVIRAVCQQLVRWQQQRLPPHRVAINLSILQVESDAFVDTTEAILRAYGVLPALIEFELTESMVLRNPERSSKVLQRLRKLGIPLSLDDFGTGYSSLAYLRQLPLDAIKIDRSFIQNIPESGEDNQIVRMIIALGKSAQMIVVAEGVETALQRDCLAALGCDFLQGFLFSPPVPCAEIERLLVKDAQQSPLAPCKNCICALPDDGSGRLESASAGT